VARFGMVVDTRRCVGCSDCVLASSRAPAIDQNLHSYATKRCFAQRRDVPIVLDHHRGSGHLAEPAGHIKSRPPFNVVRDANPARLPIHRPAEADAGAQDSAPLR